MPDKVLITGAGGYLGARLARRYLERTESAVVLWAHARNDGEAAPKRTALEELYRPWAGRVEFAFGDLADEKPFAGIDFAPIGEILHGAAVIRFNVEKEEARSINLEGAEKLLQFAASCPKLERVGLLSTVYASGMRAGLIEETPFAGEDGFCNHYEWSKWEAERALAERFADLPGRILRVATAVCDREGGGVGQRNAVHNTLMLFYYGLLSIVPGDPDVPLYFITGDFAADAVFAAMQDGGRGRSIYHVAHRREESISLRQFVDTAFDEFGNDEAFRSRRLLKPLFADIHAFELLAEGMKSFGGGVVNQSLASITPFSRQLFVHKDIRNANLVAAMPEYRAPDPLALVRHTCRELVRTRWGRE